MLLNQILPDLELKIAQLSSEEQALFLSVLQSRLGYHRESAATFFQGVEEMERHFSLIKNQFAQQEKRVFPRFPYCFLTFKVSDTLPHVFEVRDISYTGMQIALRNGAHSFKKGDLLEGILHRPGQSLPLAGEVKWTTRSKLGVAFNDSEEIGLRVREFLSIEKIIGTMRPLHHPDLALELPANLKYWLRTDGPFEIFVWHHPGVGSEYARFQIIMLKNYIEWEDGRGIKSGTILSHRNIDTPLADENEYTFEIDDPVAPDKLAFARDLLAPIGPDLLPRTTLEFLQQRLRLD